MITPVLAEGPPEAQGAVKEAVFAAAAGTTKRLKQLARSRFGKDVLLWPHLQTGSYLSPPPPSAATSQSYTSS
jgi:hypothetical protein